MTHVSSPDVRGTARSRLPAPRVSASALIKVLLRHASAAPAGPSPEQRLIVAVLVQTMVDARFGTSAERQQARRFLLGNDLSAWTQWVQLEPSFVREVAIRAGYLLPDTVRAASPVQPSDGAHDRSTDAGLQ